MKLAVAFGCAVLLSIFDAQLEPTLLDRSRVPVLYFLLVVLFVCHTFHADLFSSRPGADMLHFLEGPFKTRTRRFLALKTRGHIGTLYCGYDGNFHTFEMDYQIWVPLFLFFSLLFDEVFGYAWPHSKLRASWCFCGPFHCLLQ